MGYEGIKLSEGGSAFYSKRGGGSHGNHIHISGDDRITRMVTSTVMVRGTG